MPTRRKNPSILQLLAARLNFASSQTLPRFTPAIRLRPRGSGRSRNVQVRGPRSLRDEIWEVGRATAAASSPRHPRPVHAEPLASRVRIWKCGMRLARDDNPHLAQLPDLGRGKDRARQTAASLGGSVVRADGRLDYGNAGAGRSAFPRFPRAAIGRGKNHCGNAYSSRPQKKAANRISGGLV